MVRRVTLGQLGLTLWVAALAACVACSDDSDGRGSVEDDGEVDSDAGEESDDSEESDDETSDDETSDDADGLSDDEEAAGLPKSLPSSSAECDSASGANGCYFDGCCDELVTCSEDEDCASLYTCYVNCDEEDSNCLTSCFLASSAEDGADPFAEALACLVPLTLSCGELGGGSDDGDDDADDSDAGSGETGESEVGELGSATDSLGWDLAVSDDPLVAEFELDADLAVSETVTVDGATITATAADGTVFELEIPEGAVYGPTLITLTPLLSLEVPPLEGPAYGVQIEPDGLELMASPTLRITPPEGEEWPIDEQIPLSITGGDQSVSLALIEPESEQLALVLSHFSSYGALLSKKGLGATLSDSEIRSRFAGDVEARLQSAAAERLSQERQKQLLGAGEGSEGVASLVAELFPEYEEHVVKPRIARAGESCAAGKLAIQTVLGLERQKQLLGVMGDGEPQFIALLPVVADVCLREEYELCRDEHIITRVLPVLLSFMRQSQLLGLGTEAEGVTIPPPWVLQAEEYAKSCLQFELQFDSDVLYSKEDLSMNETVTARVAFGLTASFTTVPSDVLPPGVQEVGALISGPPGPLESTTYAVQTSEPCTTIDDQQPADGELYVSMMSFVPGITTEETPGGSPEVLDFGLSLALTPNLSEYSYTTQRVKESGCGEVLASGSDVLSWSSSLGAHVFAERATGENGAWFEAWEVQTGGGHILAVMDLSSSGADTNGGMFRGPVNMVLIHTPDP